MLKFNKVVWSEGMFLQPQHFQQQDRFTEYLIHQHYYYNNEYYNGVFALQLDETLLAQGKLGIKSGCGKFPDGSIFNIPTTEEAPIPIDIPKDTNDKIVYLGIPIMRTGVPEFSFANGDLNTKFHIKTTETIDCTSMANTTTELQTGALGLQLMLAGQNTQGYSLIGITKIKEVKSNQQVILANDFIPTCINVFAAEKLSSFVQELLIAIHNRGTMIANWMAGSEYNSPLEIQDLLLLQLINKYEAIFNINGKLAVLHPINLFSTLSQLLGELAIFTNPTYRTAIISNYNHDDLYSTFWPIILELRRMLNVLSAKQDAIRIDLEEHPYGILKTNVPEEYLVTDVECILAVTAQLHHEELKQKFLEQVKISSSIKIQALIRNALPGIPVQLLAKAPRRINFDPKALYFSIDTKHDFWQELRQAPQLAIHLSGEYPGLAIECWLIKGK